MNLFLDSIGINRGTYDDILKREGVKVPSDFDDLSETDLLSFGMKRLHINRIKKKQDLSRKDTLSNTSLNGFPSDNTRPHIISRKPTMSLPKKSDNAVVYSVKQFSPLDSVCGYVIIFFCYLL